MLLEPTQTKAWAFIVPPFEFSTCIYHKRQRFKVVLTWLGILKGMTFSVPAGLGSIAGGREAAARAPVHKPRVVIKIRVSTFINHTHCPWVEKPRAGGCH